MMSINDLEELVLRVRTPSARTYISEAVRAYQAGALRASIVATWIAVVFDIVEKLRELELAGDANAHKQVQVFDQAQRSGDVSIALTFERSILEIAKTDFELLSIQEYEDLKRLHDDRNRCAHPSMALDGMYQPSGELARYHIGNAVNHLLSHPPVQGQAALSRLLVEIESDYFPTDENDAIVHFQSGPLKKPRESLVRNFSVVLIKTLLDATVRAHKRHRLRAAFNATHQLYPKIVERASTEKLSSLLRAKPDGDLKFVVRFLSEHSFVSTCLDPDVKLRLENYVSNLPVADIHYLEEALMVPGLKTFAQQRITRLPLGRLKEILDDPFWDVPSEVYDRAVNLLRNAESYDDANILISLLRRRVAELTKGHINQILEAVANNGQVSGAFKTESLLEAIRDNGSVSTEDFAELAVAHKIEVIYPKLVAKGSDE